MKKALSLLLSVLMLLSLLAVPAYADENDGFNDGSFDWDIVDPDVPPVEPEEPVYGTKENPYPISMPATVPTEVTLAPGATIYYQFPALKFTDWSLAVTGVTAIEQNDVMHTELSLIDRCIKITLSMDGDLVGLVNDTEEEMLTIKTFLSSCGMPEKVELLPYHAMGEHKYAAIGKETQIFSVPSEEKMKHLKNIFS